VDGDRILTHDSIVGTTFLGRVVGTGFADGRVTVATEIEGMAYPAADCVFHLDADDTVGTGFSLR
jgi:proline racemase/trans-L-3-hydroxyproline dehydratase